ncbi:hypothetical protein MOO44_00865 (plasmid) [Nicoliella spurrieriana]|uniref:Uncharacterized protein n=1 Tax=Nicoliella spurrieriana TaxID=2925830 RepID=A0A976RQX9_9LACO|nr:hypothetical protein [Nicoliella spurrieriana]UQS86223.1 hypothetical protein MOO44_00865 [Nicoliella spurrieriana]
MINFKLIHDQIKQNYEHGKYGNYRNGKYEYNGPYANHNDNAKNIGDYERGRLQAINDFKTGKHFRKYPKISLEIINIVFHGRAAEVVNFIHGYNDEKRKYKNN